MDIIETLKEKMNKFFKSRKTKKECKEINKTGHEIVNRIRKKKHKLREIWKGKAWEFQQDRQRGKGKLHQQNTIERESMVMIREKK